MNAQKYSPAFLTGPMLDNYLEKGWFRMGQSVFTTHFLRFQMVLYPAIWLRYGLEGIPAEAMAGKLEKFERNFDIEIKPWVLTDEQEALFTLYRADSGLSMAESLRLILLEEDADNVFPTYQITVRKNEKLLGLGIFDLGSQSAAGISNIFHPDIKKYSPGKMLMLLKLRYCLRLGLKWFYPGYAVPGYSRFDYKLKVLPRQTQFYHGPSQVWETYHSNKGLPDYLGHLISALLNLQGLFSAAGKKIRLVYYLPFDIALTDHGIPNLVSVPVFLLIAFDSMTQTGTIAVYDLASQKFSIAGCKIVFNNGWNYHAGQWWCYDVLQLVETTEPLFTGEEILKIIGVS